MVNASRDQNNVPTLLAVNSSNGTAVVPVKVNATNHGLKIVDASTGSDNGPQTALRDQNFVPTLLAVSSVTATVNGVDYVQGVTPVVVYADSNGNLLIDST